MPHGYTEEQLASLSPTEREALTAPEEDEDTLNELAGDEDDEDETEDGEGDEGTEAPEEKPAAEDKPATDSAIDAGDDKPAAEIATPGAFDELEIEDIPPIAFKPVFSAELTAEHQAEIDALDAKLDEGEISQADYRKAERKIIGDNLAEVNAAIEWKAEQAAFFRSNKEYSADEAKRTALNAEVIKVATNTTGLTGIQILYQAKRNLDEAAEIAEARQMIRDRKAGKAPVVTGKPGKPAAARPAIQTLSNVPAADEAEVGADRFAHLDKLTGLALEAAVSRLSPADKAEYLAGA